eukprot:6203439-Pleurochrysis_carterae.AAC.1
MKATLQIDDEQQPDETDAQHAQHAQGAGGQRGGEGRRGSAALPGQQAGEGVPQPWPALLRSLGASLELLQARVALPLRQRRRAESAREKKKRGGRLEPAGRDLPRDRVGKAGDGLLAWGKADIGGGDGELGLDGCHCKMSMRVLTSGQLLRTEGRSEPGWHWEWHTVCKGLDFP